MSQFLLAWAMGIAVMRRNIVEVRNIEENVGARGFFWEKTNMIFWFWEYDVFEYSVVSKRKRVVIFGNKRRRNVSLKKRYWDWENIEEKKLRKVDSIGILLISDCRRIGERIENREKKEG